MAGRRDAEIFQKEKEEDSDLLSLSLWFSQLAKVVKEEEGAGFIKRLCWVLSASGGFKSTDAGELELRGD